VRLNPPPGKATARYVICIHDRTDRLFELVDSVLMGKVMGTPESSLALHFLGPPAEPAAANRRRFGRSSRPGCGSLE
jgi:hypothetical protein